MARYPTVEALTNYLAAEVFDIRRRDDRPEMPDLGVATVEDLDDEEATRLLASELAVLSEEGWLGER